MDKKALDLNLPKLNPEDLPVEHTEPTFQQMVAHALALLPGLPKDYFENLPKNPQRFVL